MRILMTADAVGGVWTFALVLAAALEPQGVAVELVTMGPPPSAAQRAAASRAGVAGLHETAYALEWEDDPWEGVDRAGALLLELEAALCPDLVHLNGYAHGSLPWRTPVVVAAHSDVVSWWWAVHGGPPPERYRRYGAAVEAGLRAADLVVAPTRSVVADLRRHYRFPTPCLVVANGRRAPAPASGKEPFVLGLGRFDDAAKNVAALERARASCPWPIVTAGPGTTLGRLGAREAAALLARASVFASPVLYEPFGLTILEAALGGCALVLADLPSLREVWGDAALFHPPDDEALAAALRLVVLDTELRIELAARSRRRAERFTPERLADGYGAAYARVLQAVPA